MRFELDWSEVERGSPFEQLCHDLIRALLGSQWHHYEERSDPFRADHGADGWLAQGDFEGLPAPVAFSYKSTNPSSSDKEASKALYEAFSDPKELERLKGLNPRSVVLAANHTISTDRQDKLRDLYVRERFSRPKILDRREVDLRLRNHLPVANRHFPKSGIWQSIGGARTDDETGLRKLLLDDPHAEGIPLSVRHPSLPSSWPGDQPRLLITGKPLGGKSFALAQLLAGCRPTAEVVVLKDLDRSLWDGLAWLLRRSSSPVVLAIDNLQRKVRTQRGLGLLHQLLDGAGALPSLAGILLAYRSTDRENLDLDHQRHLEERGFHRIELDEPPREFIETVVDGICAAKFIEIDAEMRRAFINRIIEWENTPGSAAAALLPYAGRKISAEAGFFPIDREAFNRREDLWRSRFRPIAEDPARVPDARLLQLLALFRSSDELDVEARVLGEILTASTGSSPSQFDAAMERLRAGGWVRQSDGKLHAHDVQVNLSTVGLGGKGYPETWLEALLALIATGGVTDPQLCISLLRAITRVYWRAEDFERCETVLDVLAGLPNPDYRDVTQLGLCRLRDGSIEPAFEDLQRAVALAPDAPEPVRVLLIQSLREGRLEESMKLLRGFYDRRSTTDPEVLLEAARWAPALRAHRLGVLLAGRAARRLPDEPKSWSILAESLYLMGKKSLAGRLLDRILSRHPRLSWALAIKASVHIDLGQNSAALALAQLGLAEAPNDPALHALVAFLHLVTGEGDLAKREVEAALKLFPDWPDLLALEARFLLADEKFEQATELARRALDRQQFLSRYTRPQALMALALSLVELGEPADAERYFLQAKHSLKAGHVLADKAKAYLNLGEKSEALQIARQAVAEGELDAHSWRQVMEVYVRNGIFHEGLRAAEAVLRIEPADRIARPIQASCLLAQDRYGEALRAAQQSAEQEEDPAFAAMHWNLAADCLARLGRWEEAGSLYRQNGTSNPKLGRQLAEAALVRQEPEEALRTVAQALEETPADARLLGLKAAAYFQRQSWEECRQALDEAATCVAEPQYLMALMQANRRLPQDGAERALELWRLGRERWPEFLAGPEGDALIELFLEREEWAAAEEAIRLKVAEEPGATAVRGKLSFCFVNQGRFEECSQAANEQLNNHPDDPVALFLRTTALKALGREAEALDVSGPLFQGISLFWAWLQVAEAACLLDRYDLAIEPFHRALDLWPDPPGDEPRMAALAGRARRLGLLPALLEALGAGQGQAPRSAVACQFAAAANEDTRERLRLLTAGSELASERPMLAVELAGHLLATGDLERASGMARQALPHCELAPAAKLGLAEILRLCGAPAEETLPLAKAAASGLEKSGKEPSRAFQVEAEILLIAGRDEDALAPAVRAARLSANPAHFMTVGRVFSKLGDYGEALRWVAKGLMAQPEHAGLHAARAALLGVLGKKQAALKAAQLLS